MATYCTLAEFKAFARLSDTSDDVLAQLAIDAASEAIDLACNTSASLFAPATVTLTTSTAVADLINTVTPHGLSAGDRIQFPSLTGGAGLSINTDYWVIGSGLTATAFAVSQLPNGPALNFTTDITAGTLTHPIPPMVKLACEIQASRWFKRQDSPFGVLGSPEFGNYTRLLSNLDPDVRLLLPGHGSLKPWGTTV